MVAVLTLYTQKSVYNSIVISCQPFISNLHVKGLSTFKTWTTYVTLMLYSLLASMYIATCLYSYVCKHRVIDLWIGVAQKHVKAHMIIDNTNIYVGQLHIPFGVYYLSNSIILSYIQQTKHSQLDLYIYNSCFAVIGN